MQKNIEEKASIPIKHGTIIVGKWNKNQYTIIRKIGSGMIGTVYLCRMHNNRLVALKISKQAMSLTTEVNVLKSLNKVQDNRLGPFLIDVDDWERQTGKSYSFYVMEYINGIRMETFIRRNGAEWIGVFIIQMLEQLEGLHQSGWVFGDLKNDNLLITESPTKVRFIDVGGTTKMGRSIKEYSEFYDRAYWHLGTREAEPSYDLFALVMVILAIYYPRHFKRSNHSKQLILKRIAVVRDLQLYEHCLQKAILGQYKLASEMKADLLQTMWKRHKKENKKRAAKGNYVIQAVIISSLSGVYYLVSSLFF
ncbi:protein kinase [Pseudogracilibacillus auburnensis]|uniref:Serine/threonine-protein kinase n=1 Tax=Pseudogracilibacillus auburnensis TaxID=1494959 RepID=A0A2V3VID2_9BACI|nr:protein kinase [Pseudogracilibacillus auburnensis]PXW81563.1 serine/threonine-protein kinase [Pseudogracilibacillus auburnensis]